MVLIILGPQGSGKNTQAQLLAKHYGAAKYFNGDELRAAIAGGSDLGRKIKPIVDRGDLVPDQYVIDLMRATLPTLDLSRGVIFEGIPRTMAQVEPLLGLLKEFGLPSPLLIELQISDETAIKRLLARKRADDTVEVIKSRLAHYHRSTQPVIEYFKKLGSHIAINGEPAIGKVYETILGEIGDRRS